MYDESKDLLAKRAAEARELPFPSRTKEIYGGPGDDYLDGAGNDDSIYGEEGDRPGPFRRRAGNGTRPRP